MYTTKRPNITNIHHYQIVCLNSVIDRQLREFNERFHEVNYSLLVHMASFNPKNSLMIFGSSMKDSMNFGVALTMSERTKDLPIWMALMILLKCWWALGSILSFLWCINF
ncbi:hypothetical protein ACQJBY_049259 [Aegilops geniculata]